jgi:hypothetical protein
VLTRFFVWTSSLPHAVDTRIAVVHIFYVGTFYTPSV